MKKWLIFIFLATFISGCNSSAKNDTDNNFNSNNSEIVLKGYNSMQQDSYQILKEGQVPHDYIEYSEGVEESLIFYSDTLSDVEKFRVEYEKLTGESAPTFDGAIVIAKMGTKSSGGYKIELENIDDSGRFTILTLNYITPKKGSLTTSSFTNPFIIIYLPENHKDIKIVKNNK